MVTRCLRKRIHVDGILSIEDRRLVNAITGCIEIDYDNGETVWNPGSYWLASSRDLPETEAGGWLFNVKIEQLARTNLPAMGRVTNSRGIE